jgi:uracil-DNA glycosylase
MELEEIESKLGEIFPNEQNVLRFLQNDLNKIKVVIVGMEPYPSSFDLNGATYPVATGRSFEIANVTNWNQKFKQSSLRNILKTVYFNEYGENIPLEDIRKKILNNDFPIKQPKDWFDSLENQGVLFLNATLTVEPYNVDSHTKIWSDFMNDLIVYMVNNNPNIKWFLWGDKAKQRFSPYLNENNMYLSCHPRLANFVNENPFQYEKNINWLG